MIASLLSIKISVHVIDNSNNELRDGGVKRDAGGDEKQLIMFSWPYYAHMKVGFHIKYLARRRGCILSLKGH